MGPARHYEVFLISTDNAALLVDVAGNKFASWSRVNSRRFGSMASVGLVVIVSLM